MTSTASAANLDYVKSLGADEVIDYNAQDFTTIVSGCDAVFDTVGGEVTQRSFAVLKPGGRAAFIASGGKAPEAPRSDVESLRPQVGRDREHLKRIESLQSAAATNADLRALSDYRLAIALTGLGQPPSRVKPMLERSRAVLAERT